MLGGNHMWKSFGSPRGPRKTDREQWQPGTASVMAQYKKMILAPNGLKKKKKKKKKEEEDGTEEGGEGREGLGEGVIHLQISPWRSGLFQAASGCQELTR